MKKVFLGILLLTLLLVPSATFAQVSNYNADFQVQNLSSSNVANIVITFYDQTGAQAAQVSDTIPADSSTTFSPLPSAVPAGFNGSVVISSDQPVAAIANVKGTGNGADYGSSYSSFSGGTQVASLPIINKDFFNINTWFNVQNTGSASTNVTVSYSGQPTCDETKPIPANAAATFDQATNSCLPSNFNGSATITADTGGEIVATALQVASTGLFAYSGFPSGDTNVVMPLVTNNVFGIHTGIQIQNQGTQATNVTVTYTPSQAGTACTESTTIQAGSAGTFAINALSFPSTGTTSNCTLGEFWIGSAQVTTNSTNQPLVAVINQTNFTNSGGSSYGGFSPSAATDTVVMPLLMDAFNIWTGWSVMNVGGSSATINCTYSGTSIAVSFPNIASNEAVAVQNINGGTGDVAQTLPSSYIGSGTCTAPGTTLVGVVNQANRNVPAGSGDGILTYEAFSN